MSTLAHVQGGILKFHGRKHACLIYLNFPTKVSAEGIRFIRLFSTRLTSHQDQLRQTAKHKFNVKHQNKLEACSSILYNFFLSYRGYLALGIKPEYIPNDPSFKHSLSKSEQRELLGIYNVDNSQKCVPINSSAVIQLSCADEPILAAAIAQTKKDFSEQFGDVAILDTQLLYTEKDEEDDKYIDNFKIADGFTDQRRSTALSNQILIEETIHDISPCKRYYGTYVAMLKINQNFEAFHKHALSIAENVNIPADVEAADYGKALIVGRFPNGTPIALSERPLPAHYWENHAPSFKNLDKSGLKCPYHAHVRAVNPYPTAASAPKIARRSMLFNDEKDKENKKGLLFISLQASLLKDFIPLFWRMGIPQLKQFAYIKMNELKSIYKKYKHENDEELEKKLTNHLGDQAIAKKVRERLQKKQFVNHSLLIPRPELTDFDQMTNQGVHQRIDALTWTSINHLHEEDCEDPSGETPNNFCISYPIDRANPKSAQVVLPPGGNLFLKHLGGEYYFAPSIYYLQNLDLFLKAPPSDG